MKLLFTGGTGFFGKAVLRQIAPFYSDNGNVSNDHITILTRDPDGFLRRHPQFGRQSWISFVKGDIQDMSTLPKRSGFTHILHAAADSTDPSRLTALQRYDQIVQGTRNLLDFAASNGVRRFLLTSSGGVYGPQPSDIDAIPEDFHRMPNPMCIANVYGIAKRQAEHLCALYREQFGIETIVARCFAFVGEDLPLDAHFAIGNFIRDALFSEQIIVGGDGTPLRSYMDQFELARWLMVLLRDSDSGKVYNVGAAEAITIAELAYLIRDTLAPQKKVQILRQANLDNIGRSRYVPDISRAQADLGLTNDVPLKQAILRAATGVLHHRNAN
jgi:UDP-glucuronate decarboxylase